MQPPGFLTVSLLNSVFAPDRFWRISICDSDFDPEPYTPAPIITLHPSTQDLFADHRFDTGDSHAQLPRVAAVPASLEKHPVPQTLKFDL